MAILSNLEPKRVFEIFEEMCAIPHGSTNTKAISDWCVAFGEKLGLEHYQDEANNVILIAPATPGYEDAPAVILQGHVDMVCEKEAGCAKDMDKEGLDLFVDGDLVGARGTTLGGDDGIAVAMALAALEDTTLQHPRLEVVLTTDEEIGMLGAAVLDVTPLQGRTMLNIDSEEEGIFTVGCAGGSSVFCHLPLIRENFSGETLEVRVPGLRAVTPAWRSTRAVPTPMCCWGGCCGPCLPRRSCVWCPPRAAARTTPSPRRRRRWSPWLTAVRPGRLRRRWLRR